MSDAPSDGPEGTRRADRVAWGARVLVSVAAGGVLAGLLWQLLFRGWAHSFDAMMYARGIWGLARGDGFNPVAERQTLSVHAHVTSLFLAPWTRVLPAALVLVLAQATAFGATVWTTVAAVQRSEATGRTPRAVTLAAVCAAALVCASPWVTNPFLFDARPDLLGVPFCLAGLLRVRERAAFDARAVVYLALAVLSREEFALPVAMAALFAPLEPKAVGGWGARAVAAAIPLIWWSLYWLFGRLAIGGEAAIAAGIVPGSGMLEVRETAVHSWRLVLTYKIEALSTFFLTAGAFGWRQWRWLLVASPGLLLALANQRMQEHVLNLHYSMFAIPGLLVAAVAGYEALARDGARARVRARAIGAAVIALACFVVASAAPGGGRFRPQNFCFGRPLWRRDIAEPADPARVAAAHAALAAVPREQGLAVPYAVGAPYADRSLILAIDQVNERRAADATLQWAALYPRSWARRGRYLVERASFRVAAFAEPDLLILRREGRASRGEVPRPARAASPCGRPLVTWPLAGLAACAVESSPRRKPALTAARIGPADPSLGDAPLQLWLLPASGAPIELLSLQGVLNPRDLGATAARFVPAEPVGDGVLRVVLTRDGRPLPTGFAGNDRAPVHWPAWAVPRR